MLDDVFEFGGDYTDRTEIWCILYTFADYLSSEGELVGRDVLGHVRNTQLFCLLDLCCNKNLRGAWKKRSPRMAAMRLNCGVRAFEVPVSNGDP